VVGVFLGHGQLLLGLLADDGLVHQHVVEDAAEAVLDVLIFEADLDGLADGYA